MRIFSKSSAEEPATPEETRQRVSELEEEIRSLKEEVEGFKAAMRKAVTKVGITRFNPFNEVGGDQSFSVALLDEEDNGIVVTSHYGRDMNRVYAKPIRNGESSYSLSSEEENVVKEAQANE